MSALDEKLADAAGLIGDTQKCLNAAVRRMADATPGYPSGRTGVPHGPDADVHLTQPERFTDTLRDEAVKDYEALVKAVSRLHTASRDVYGYATKWGVTKDTRNVEGQLRVADPEDDMWCKSCLRIRHFAPRRAQGGVNCDWCAATLRDLNQTRAGQGRKALEELPRQALQAHAEGRRVYQKDLERWAGIGDIRSERNARRKRKVS